MQELAAFNLPNTGGWTSWQDAIVPDIVLPEGERILRFTLTGSAGLLNYVEFMRDQNPADITRSGRVDMDDFAVLAAQWMGEPGTPSADITPVNGDGRVDLLDLLILIENWLKTE